MTKNKWNKIKKEQKKGYTLVEMIVVLVIMAILVSLGAWGFVGYQKYAMFKKNNEYAKTIFISAQNALTHVKATGQIENLKELLEQDGKTPLTKSSFEGAYEEQLPENRVYSVILPKDKKNITSEADKKIYELLAPYIYDEEIMDAVICIEFDPADATVWGVCYNDRAQSFSYIGENTEKKNNIGKRKESDRREVFLGYYGVDMLSDPVPEGSGEAVIDEAELINEDMLRIAWTIGDTYTAAEFDYNLELKHNAEVVSEFVLPKDVVKSMTNTPKNIELQVDGEEVQFLAYTEEKDGKTIYNLVLDAIDYGANEELEEAAGNEEPEYEDTYNIFRLMPQLLNKPYSENTRPKFDALGIEASIQAVGPSTSKTLTTNQANALFGHEYVADVSVGEDSENTIKEVTYTIDNARHLYNVRFMEAALKKAGAENSSVNYVYRQQSRHVDGPISGIKDFTGDVVWTKAEGTETNGIVENNAVFDEGQLVQITESSPRQTIQFPAIKELGKKSSFIGMETLPTTGEEKPYQVFGLNLIETTANIPLGLFAKNGGTIRDTSFAGATVKGVKFVGTACGVNAGILERVSTDQTSAVTGINYIGGIVGTDVTGLRDNLTDSQGKRVYKELHNGAKVSGESYIGGIVGYSYNNMGEQDGYRIEACENTGFVHGTKIDGICIGGITGYSYNTELLECKSNPLGATIEKATAKTYLNGYFVGGLVGFNRNGKITQCITGAPELENRGWVAGYKYVGGIVGVTTADFGPSDAIAKPLTLDAGTENPSKSEVNVAGDSNVGGVVGVFAEVMANVGSESFKLEAVLDERDTPERFGLTAKTNIGDIEVANWEYNGTIHAKANAGGIVGWNYARVRNCTAKELAIIGERLRNDTVQGTIAEVENLGGITGANTGLIDSCIVSDIQLEAVGGMISNLGGIAGLNSIHEKYTNSLIDSNVTTALNIKVSISAGVSGEVSNLGGIAGSSKVTIAGCSTKAVRFEIIGFDNWRQKSVARYFGGIVGIVNNNGTNKIADCNTQETEFHFTDISDSESHFGGIVGLNNVPIENCTVGAVSINEGTITDWMGTTRYLKWPVGGITGESNNTITNCSVERVSGGSYIGGIAVVNKNKIENCTVNYQGNENIPNVWGRDNIGGIANENIGDIVSCTVNNINGANVQGLNNVGGIANENKGTITNTVLNKTGWGDSVVGNDEVAGIASVNSGTITNTAVNLAPGLGVAVKGNDYVGGLVGRNRASGVIQNGKSNNVEGVNYVGGIVAVNEGNITNAVLAQNANIVGADTVGGLVAYQQGGSVQGNTNVAENGQANVTGTANVGGYYGVEDAGGSISGAHNYATVEGKTNVGGVIGLTLKGIQVNDTANHGDIICNENGAGGIIGGVASNTAEAKAIHLNNCQNFGDLTASAGRGNRGGIVGYLSKDVTNSTVSITQSTNIGNIEYPDAGNTNGGILGADYTNTSISPKIAQCENYGLPVGSQEYPMSGIVGYTENVENLIVKDCYGVSQCGYPIMGKQATWNMQESTGNYFFVKPLLPGEPPKPNVIDKIRIQENENVNCNVNKNETNWLDGNLTTSTTVKALNSGDVSFTFKMPGNGLILKSVNIFWDGKNKSYEYSLFPHMSNGQGEQIEGLQGIGTDSEEYRVTETILTDPQGYDNLTIIVHGLKAGETLSIKEIFFNGYPDTNETTMSLPQNPYSNTNGEWGMGAPLYIKSDGTRYDAYKNASTIAIQDLPLDPTELRYNNTASGLAYYNNLDFRQKLEDGRR